MLVLSRKQEESIVIGSNVVVKVVAIRGNSVQLAFEAPPEVTIHRSEVHARIQAQRRGAPNDRTQSDAPPRRSAPTGRAEPALAAR